MNKKLAINLCGAAWIWAAGLLFTACNRCKKNEQAKSAIGTSEVITDKIVSTDKIVYVNSDSLLNNFDYFKKLRSRLREKSKKAQADLASKGTAFQQEVASYQKSGTNLSAEQRAATEQRLVRKQQELSAYSQNASDAFVKEEAAENEKLYDKVAQYLEKHAKDKGYKMVLTYSKSNPGLLYADKTLDITKEVVKGLNQEYGNGK